MYLAPIDSFFSAIGYLILAAIWMLFIYIALHSMFGQGKSQHNPYSSKKSDLDSRTAVIVIISGALAVIMTVVSCVYYNSLEVGDYDYSRIREWAERSESPEFHAAFVKAYEDKVITEGEYSQLDRINDEYYKRLRDQATADKAMKSRAKLDALAAAKSKESQPTK